MSDYNDIARRRPQEAMNVISSFGYEILDRSNLGQSLNELIANEGEPALIEVMNIHPDKNIILELFSEKKENSKIDNSKKCGGCESCSKNRIQEQFMNASGSESSLSNTSNNASKQDNSNTIAHQTNTILVVATLFILTTILIKTNK